MPGGQSLLCLLGASGFGGEEVACSISRHPCASRVWSPDNVEGWHGVIIGSGDIHDGRKGEDAFNKVEVKIFSILVLNVIKNTIYDGGSTTSFQDRVAKDSQKRNLWQKFYI